MEKIWECKIGGEVGDLPAGADGPMRRAVQTAFKTLTGVEASFTFSGWGATLTEGERAVHENREPNWDAMQEAIGAGDEGTGGNEMTSENVYTEIVAERGATVIPDLLRGNAGNVGEIGALLDLSADEIDRLRTTIERLREALESIAGGEIYPVQAALDALMAEVEGTK